MTGPIVSGSFRAGGAPPVIEIAPTTGLASFRFAELWAGRELLWFLIWRDVKIRYKQTVLGISWAIVQPLTATVIFTLVFGRLAKLPSDGVPYPLFTIAALLVWNFIAAGIGRAANSLVSSASMVTKVYFPRLLVPMAAACVGAPDFLVTLALLCGLMAFYGIVPGVAIAALPFFCALALMTTVGVGFWLAALNARYRDVGHLVPFVMQVWQFASPVAYSSHLVSPRWQAAYAVNPVAGIIDGFRWALLGIPPAPLTIAVSFVVSLALLTSGACYFKVRERTVADVI